MTPIGMKASKCGLETVESPWIGAAAGNSIVAAIAGSLGTSRGKGRKPGSVSSKLIHYAGCSMLILRPVERF